MFYSIKLQIRKRVVLSIPSANKIVVCIWEEPADNFRIFLFKEDRRKILSNEGQILWRKF